MNYSPAKRALLAMAAMAAVLAIAACGSGDEPSTPESSSGPVALEVPDIEISAYQGQDVLGGDTASLSEIVGQGKPVVLNFWAALCPPCRAEIPEFESVYHERSDEVTILGIDIGPQQLLGTREEGQALLAELGATYPAGTTFDEAVARGFEVFSMPTTFFIAADGSVLRKWSGILDEAKLNELVDELVGGTTVSGMTSEDASASGQADAAGLGGDEFA
ncbi:MAG: TlpA disulfide reductase family protein [Chloroflexi bacterium]|nr:TlpA disulfide reductase family protein [Chloroflexota bacterium]